MKQHPVVKSLRLAFEAQADEQVAAGMQAYMKNQFPFLGIKKPVRSAIEQTFRPVFKVLSLAEYETVIRQLWHLPYREFQYAAMELMRLRVREWSEAQVPLLEALISEKPWWDTVDFIAAHPVGTLLRQQPELRKALIAKWTATGNLWFRRTCILFQLRYGHQTDQQLLFDLCTRYAGEKDFFLRKAIGWALRQYSKSNPDAVSKYIQQQPLSGLSLREASKYL